jgi:hypothetical protein
MKKLIFCSLAFLGIQSIVSGQSTAVSGNGKNSPEAVAYAYANGDDTYLQFESDHYKPGKKYVVLKFWSKDEQLTEAEQSEIKKLTGLLAKKNVELVSFQWKTEEELEAKLKAYDLSVDVNDDKRIRISSGDFQLNTTATKSMVVLEDNKPVSLCSGKGCEERLKKYFKLVSTD